MKRDKIDWLYIVKINGQRSQLQDSHSEEDKTITQKENLHIASTCEIMKLLST